jgi:sec-independent protein translocase protein TatA
MKSNFSLAKRPIMFGYSWGPILIILVIVLLLFGPKRLPELGESIGKAINSFKKAHEEPENLTHKQEAASASEGSTSETKKNSCPQCQKELGGDFAFCPHCGHNLKAA